MKVQTTTKVIVHHEGWEFTVLVPSVDLATDNPGYEYVVELPASVVEAYEAERDAASAALWAAEEKFRAYLDDNNIRWE
jgi:hypothetical protein